MEDDQSNAATAVAIYEKLITRDKVDVILGPCTSPITEAVADVTEKHKMPMVAPTAAGTSIFKKGRKFIFMVLQWQDGKKVIVWPEELAPVKARFPTPPWSQRQ